MIVRWSSTSSRMPLSPSAIRVVERLALEGQAFGRALHLDEPPVAGLHDVHVHVRARVLLVGEVQHRHAADHADARRGHVIVHGDRLDLSRRAHVLHGEHHRDEPAGDRRGARAAVGLNHVAVDPDRPLAQLRQPRDRSQRSADEPLDLLRASADLARAGLALRAGRRRARQHPVLRGDPALAGVAQKRRHAILDARRAHDTRASDLDQDRSFRVQEKPRCELRRPQIRRHPSIAACHVVALFRPDPFQVLLQRMSEVDVSGQRVDLLALDEDLHARDCRQIRRQRVDDRVDREELVEGPAGVPGPGVRAQIHERVAALRQVQRPQRRPWRNRRDERVSAPPRAAR